MIIIILISSSFLQFSLKTESFRLQKKVAITLPHLFGFYIRRDNYLFKKKSYNIVILKNITLPFQKSEKKYSHEL